MSVMVFETERLRMRPLAVEDAEALHALYADAVAMTWWSHPAFTTIGQTRDAVARNLSRQDWRVWAMTVAGDDTAIGTLAAHELRQGRVTEIGYSLVRAHGGNGLGGEAVAALVDRLFADGQRRLFADVDPDNMPSIRLLERLGFTREGLLRGHWETHLGVRDSLIYGLLRDEWALPPDGARAEAATCPAT